MNDHVIESSPQCALLLCVCVCVCVCKERLLDLLPQTLKCDFYDVYINSPNLLCVREEPRTPVFLITVCVCVCVCVFADKHSVVKLYCRTLTFPGFPCASSSSLYCTFKFLEQIHTFLLTYHSSGAPTFQPDWTHTHTH